MSFIDYFLHHFDGINWVGKENRNRRTTGSYGEYLALNFLKNLGYEIIEQNYHYGHGEIDIIAMDHEVLVFVEVKYRRNLEYGPPAYGITGVKQRQVRKIAEAYLYEKEIRDRVCRFDAVAILHWPGEKPEITHFINAF